MSNQQANLEKLNQAEDKYLEAWESDNSIDFDAALDEHKKGEEPVAVTFLGKTYEVPPAMPVSVWLYHERHVDKKGNLPDDKALEYIKKVIGKKFVDALEDSDVTVTFVMEKIIPAITRRWGVRKKK